jgi:uncharacterized protein with PQ loop repeat
MSRFSRVALAVLAPTSVLLVGCNDEILRNTRSLLLPEFQRSEVVGVVAGFGTTFAGMPDLLAMLKRKSTAGMNPSMSAIMGVFQVAWVYYGLLIVSRPVVIWNLMGVLINTFSVGAYFHFARMEKRNRANNPSSAQGR